MSDKEYTDQQYLALKYSYEQFDKNVLFIASGALGISFAFIEKVIPNLAQAFKTNLLINSWYCFAGVIFISLLAHFISTQAIRWSIEKKGSKNYKRNRKYINLIIRFINTLQIAGLLLGIILLISFIKLNIN